MLKEVSPITQELELLSSTPAVMRQLLAIRKKHIIGVTTAVLVKFSPILLIDSIRGAHRPYTLFTQSEFFTYVYHFPRAFVFWSIDAGIAIAASLDWETYRRIMWIKYISYMLQLIDTNLIGILIALLICCTVSHMHSTLKEIKMLALLACRCVATMEAWMHAPLN